MKFMYFNGRKFVLTFIKFQRKKLLFKVLLFFRLG